MKAPVYRRTAHAFLRLGLLVLAFVCVAHSPATAQSCSAPGCVIIFAGDNNGGNCFTLNRFELSCPVYSPLNTLTSHIDFGQTVDFYQPSNIPFGAHSATSGNCCAGTSSFFRAPPGAVGPTVMTSSTDYKYAFDGSNTPPGGFRNAGTYNYYCEPHGIMMKGILIVDPDATTTALTVNFNPSVFNQTVTFTATVSSAPPSGISITPTGTVIFYDGTTQISTALPLSSGSVTFATPSLSVASHSITAQFSDPNNNFVGSTSNAINQVVNPDSTATNLVVDINPSVFNQNVTFTATVSNTSGVSVTPSGTVTLYDGVTAIAGPSLLSSGSVNFPTSSLSGGSHSITAQFSDPNGNFSPSTSNTVPQVVRDFSINISNPSLSVLPTQTATYNGLLSSLGAYTGTISIGCQGSQPMTCTGGSVSLPANAQNVPFTVTASHPSVATFNFNIVGNGPSSVSHSSPVTLTVSSFTFTPLNPSTISTAQGNPTSPMAFQIIPSASLSGEMDMDCSVFPPNVTCRFSNGLLFQALSVSPGVTINDTLVLDPSFAAAPGGPFTVTVRATPKAAPSQLQTHDVALTITNGGGTQASTNLYFGNSPDGTAQNLKNPPFLVGTGNRFTFDVSAINNELSADSHNVNITLLFAQPVKASAVVSRGLGGDTCGLLINSIQISCTLGTITAAAPKIKTVTYTVTPIFGRSVDFTAILSESDRNPGTPTTLFGSVKVRYRPLVRPGLKPGNTNPK